MSISPNSPPPRLQIAKATPEARQAAAVYQVYWFADVRGGRAGVCTCSDYFNRNLVQDDTRHLCIHLKRLRVIVVPLLQGQIAAGTIPGDTTLVELVRALNMFTRDEEQEFARLVVGLSAEKADEVCAVYLSRGA